MIKYVNSSFDDEIKEGIIVLDFYAEWCGPCRMLSPIIEDISKNINVIKINVDEYGEIATKYRIMSIPTLVILKDGVLQKELVGFKPKEEILKEIEKIN